MSSQSPTRSPQPPARKSAIAAEKRKLRNRLSQQAFRARQNSEINELKQCLAQFSKSESDRNRSLGRDNQVLRQQLFHCEQKLRSLQATLKDIINDVASDRNAERGLGNHDSPPQSLHADLVTSGIHLSPQDEVQIDHIDGFDMSASVYDIELNNIITEPTGASDISEPQQHIGILTETAVPAKNNSGLRALAPTRATVAPASVDWSVGGGLETLMNTKRFESIETAPAATSPTTSTELPLYRSLQAMARSRYSEHIHAYEMCVVMSYSGENRNPDLRSLHQLTAALIGTFVKGAWQGMESWMKNTNGEEQLAKLTAWRICPNTDTLAALPDLLTPTLLQTAVPHPAVIDWCIFPFLRNKLIQYHSSDPALDEICGHIGMAYVVQADLSELVVDTEPLSANFSVCDIISGMENNQSLWEGTDAANNATVQVELPAPSLHALLHTREYARAMYRHFGISNGIGRFRVDPELFKRYPHLCQPDSKIAQGMPLRSYNKVSWIAPRSLDELMMRCYRQCVSQHASRTSPRLAMEDW